MSPEKTKDYESGLEILILKSCYYSYFERSCSKLKEHHILTIMYQNELY